MKIGIFLDTSFILALKDKDDKNHDAAQKWMKRFLKNEFGKIYTSTFVFDELATLIMIRLKNLEFAKKICTYLLSSPRINILSLDNNNFIQTWEKFQKFWPKELSFTDCSILVQCQDLKCDMVATFDHHFVGLIGTNLN